MQLRAPHSRQSVLPALRELGVRPGSVLVVHASLRAVGPVEGGADAVIDLLEQLLGPSGTLVMPAMSGSRRSQPFDPETTPSRGMGVLAETFRRRANVLRSGHPTSSFAACGPHAPAITAPQPLSPVHGPDSPVGRVLALDGDVLLLGVGHDANTTIHLAETLFGVPYRVTKWATERHHGKDVHVTFSESDHCCRRFDIVGEALWSSELEWRAPVGSALARRARARDVVAVALDILDREPLAFLCAADDGCAECDAARASVPR